jgi:hypothetical protein
MNEQPVVLYLHIPKAGGTTLSDWLYQQLRDHRRQSSEAEEDRWLREAVFYYPSGYVRGPYEHDTAIINRVLPRPNVNGVLGHFKFGIHSRLTRPARYVTMLRHPVERILSLYHFERLMQERYGEHQGIRMPMETTLESFLQSPPFEEVDNGMLRRISGVSPRLGGCTDDMLQQAKANLRNHFAVVGVTERFDETLMLVKKAFSWDSDVFYYPKNTNPGRKAVTLKSQEAFNAILESNEFDFELYKFALELMDSAIESYGALFESDLKDFTSRNRAWYEQVTSDELGHRYGQGLQRN